MDSAEQLQQLYVAGFDLQTFERFPKAIGVLRDNCLAFLVPGPDGLQILGNVGWRMGESLGPLVERGANRSELARRGELPVHNQQYGLSKLLNFLEDVR